MQTLLVIQASLFGHNGRSSQLAAEYVDAWRKAHPNGRVIIRDLAADPVPQLTAERFQAFIAPERTPEQQAIADYSAMLIDELTSADEIVLAVPMYNFNIPTGLQNWFDHVARAGITFRYTENGPEGLVKGKRVRVFIARGGQYGETHSQTAYLRQILSFMGMSDIVFVHAEGLNINETVREQALTKARRVIEELVEQRAVA